MESEFNQWTDKSKDIPFEKTKKGLGNGEEKLAKEFDISNLGGQNSTIDLIHPTLGPCSVKQLTKDNTSRLGTECCNDMGIILRKTVNLFLSWIEKYKSKCNLANKFYNDMNKTYGRARITIIQGIDRLELAEHNLQKLNELLNELKKYKSENKYDSLKSEYIDDIINSLNDKSLQDMLNECVRKEAKSMKLIIVHEKKGWLIVQDLNKLSCPRITHRAPRMKYDNN